MENIDSKLQTALSRRQQQEFDFLSALPEEYKIAIKYNALNTQIQVAFDDSLVKSIGYEKFPKLFQFTILIDKNFPLTPPKLYVLTHVFFLIKIIKSLEILP